MASTSRPIAAVVVAAVLFGTSGTAQELGPDDATPLSIGAVRLLVGTITLWAFVAVRPNGPSRARVAASIRAGRLPILIGGVGVATYTPTFLAGASRAGVAVATVVTIGSGPFFAGGLEWMTRGRRPRFWWLVGTVVTVTGGILLVLSTEAPGKDVDAIGLLLALLAGMGYAVYSVTAKTTMERGMDSTVALAAPFTIGALLLAMLSITEPYRWLGSGSGITMVLHLGILVTGGAYILFGYGLDRLTAATTVTLVLIEPLTAVLLATVLLDESIAPAGWVGIVIVLAGLVVVGLTAEATPESVLPAM